MFGSVFVPQYFFYRDMQQQVPRSPLQARHSEKANNNGMIYYVSGKLYGLFDHLAQLPEQLLAYFLDLELPVTDITVAQIIGTGFR